MGDLVLDLGPVFRPYRKQVEFLTSRAWNRYFLAGRGAGKSWSLTLDALVQALVNPGCPGALLGRTTKEVARKLLPQLRAHLDALARHTGVNWVKHWDSGGQTIHLVNGSSIYWSGYERVDKLRGENLAWVVADEICWSETDEITVYETLISTIRVPCPRPGFSIGSSPNGLRGVTALFRDRQIAGDPEWQVFRATSYDNPHLGRHVIETWRAAMSKRRYEQEVLALALRPMSAVYHEFSAQRHVVPWSARHHPEARWLFAVDWGLNRAIALAIQVLPDGRWVVVDELVRKPESRGHFRSDLRAWIASKCGDQAPFLISADRAVPEENAWLRAVYGPQRTQVLALSSKHDQYVRNGIALVQDMLAPVVGEPRLLFASSLSMGSDGEVAGILPAMLGYRYKVDQNGVATDEPLKDNVTDHAVDALRYIVVAGSRFKELHAGRLPLRPNVGPDGVLADGGDGGNRPHF